MSLMMYTGTVKQFGRRKNLFPICSTNTSAVSLTQELMDYQPNWIGRLVKPINLGEDVWSLLYVKIDLTKRLL